MAGFIQLLRTEPADELLRFPNAFALLTLIALRARREVPQINPHGLQIGEAMIGDHAAVGLSRQEFRSALSNLQKWSLVTIRATNKGTIAKLSGTSIYDINAGACNQQNNQPATSQQPANNQPATTNNNVIKEELKKRKNNDLQDAASPAVELTSSLQAEKAAEPRGAAEVLADEAAVFTIAGFRAFVNAIGFGKIDVGFYLPQIQYEAGKQAARPNAGPGKTWEAFVKFYLNNERKYDRLTYPVVPGSPTGYHAGPNPALQVTTTSTSYSREAIAARNVTKY